MAILPIVQFPNPVLAMKCQPVSEVNDTIRRLAADMGETMYKAPGVGLAAPQVGEPIRMVVIDVSEEKNNLLTLINPVITEYSDEKETGEEGCLSLPGIWEKVTRSTAITVQYTDLDGQPQEIHAEGLLAICIQHELDHLDGTVFIDHLSRLKYDRVNHSELRSAESLFSAARTKQLMGSQDEALALMDSTVAFFGDLLTEKAAPYVFQRAQMKVEAGKFREAVADYNEYEKLVLGKASAEFFYVREQAEMQCRLYQQALDDIEKAVEMDPKQVLYVVEQVALYTRFSQFDKAVEAARKGIALAPDNADLYRMLGFGQIQLKQKEEGKKNLLKAKELGDPNAQTLLDKYAK